jgi:hypothetical protein
MDAMLTPLPVCALPCILPAALDLLASELTDTGVAALGKLPHLCELKLYQAGVTAEGLAMLAGQPAGSGLHSLVLYGTGGLRELACLGKEQWRFDDGPADQTVTCMQSRSIN